MKLNDWDLEMSTFWEARCRQVCTEPSTMSASEGSTLRISETKLV